MAAIQEPITQYYKNNSAAATTIPSMYVTSEVIDNVVVPVQSKIYPGVKQ